MLGKADLSHCVCTEVSTNTRMRAFATSVSFCTCRSPRTSREITKVP